MTLVKLRSGRDAGSWCPDIGEINFLKQDPEKEPGDVVPPGVPWARYPDGYDVWLGDGSTKQVGKDDPLGLETCGFGG